jgi:hypothetical protein
MRSLKASTLCGNARPRVEALEDRTLLSLLYSNGNKTWVTGLGNGANGANTSQIDAVGNNFGYSCLNSTFHCADDFTVPDGANWSISSFGIYTYQTGNYGNPPASPITGVFLRLWDGTNGPPGAGATVVAATSGNLISTNTWTGVYRVTNTTLTNAQRPVMIVGADVSGWDDFQNQTGGVLSSGHYWLEWGVSGNSQFTGPWTPPTIPRMSTDNARQLTVSNNTWSPVIDTGGTNGPQDLLFDVEGDSVSAPVATIRSNPILPGNSTQSSTAAISGTPVFDTGIQPLDTAVVDQVHLSAVQDHAAPVATLAPAPAGNNLSDGLSQDQLFA